MHPEWKDKQPFKAVLEGDMKALADPASTAGEAGHGDACRHDHGRIRGDRQDWLATARHPHFERPYTELVFQPMVEVLAYLRANDFKTFIVSGGGIEFMRPWPSRSTGYRPSR